MHVEDRLSQMTQRVVCEIPTYVSDPYLSSSCQLRRIHKLRNGLLNRLQSLEGAQFYVLRVELSDLEFLLSREVHHEDVEGVGTV